MTTEKMLELQTSLLLTENIIQSVDSKGRFEFKGRLYNYNQMVERQLELFEEFIEPYEEADEAYVIEENEKSE